MPNKYNPETHHRRSIRLRGYDYSQAGAYFVTICAWNKECLFGEISGGQMRLNQYGQIVQNSLKWLARQYQYLELDTFVVMPNHLHSILIINGYDEGGSRTAPTNTAPTNNTHKPLSRLIGAFKTVSSKNVNIIRNMPGFPLWQRNYYEHIIRNDDDMERIRGYIETNPVRWQDDEENPLYRCHPSPE